MLLLLLLLLLYTKGEVKPSEEDDDASGEVRDVGAGEELASGCGDDVGVDVGRPAAEELSEEVACWEGRDEEVEEAAADELGARLVDGEVALEETVDADEELAPLKDGETEGEEDGEEEEEDELEEEEEEEDELLLLLDEEDDRGEEEDEEEEETAGAAGA